MQNNTTILKLERKWISGRNVKKILYINVIFSLGKKLGGGYYVRELTSEQYTRIKSAENIYVFGAGTIARELADILDRMEKRILAYLVSDYTSRNPESLYGVPVVKLSEIENKDKNACVIIATIPRYHNDIKTLLTEKGLTNILTIT